MSTCDTTENGFNIFSQTVINIINPNNSIFFKRDFALFFLSLLLLVKNMLVSDFKISI